MIPGNREALIDQKIGFEFALHKNTTPITKQMFSDLVLVLASHKEAFPDTDPLFNPLTPIQRDTSMCTPVFVDWRQLYVDFVVWLSIARKDFDTLAFLSF